MRGVFPLLVLLLLRVVVGPVGQPLRAEEADRDAAADFVYELRLVLSPAPALHVTLWLAGDPSGRTELFCAPDWGGARGGEQIEGLSVQTASGEVLPAARTERHRWDVEHDPGAPLVVRYHVNANDFQRQGGSERNQVFLNERLLHAAGEILLLRPDPLPEKESCVFDLRFPGFEEAGWEVVCSYGISVSNLRVEQDPERFYSSVFLAGDLVILDREVMGEPVHVALQDDGWDFEPDDFADVVAGIIEQQRTFFEDFDDPFYLVTLIPVGEARPGSRSIGGSGLTDSFMLQVQRGLSLAPGSDDRLALVKLLEHEMFHRWNGHLLEREEPSLAATWFSEGFTDFYARRLLWRGGWISLAEYASLLNEMLRRHAISPVRDVPNSRITADFWRDRAVQDLPYVRGDLAALLLDHAIRRHSDDARSLDDLMRALMDRARASGFRFSNEAFFAELPAWTGEDFAAPFEKFIQDGVAMELPADLLAPCLTASMEETHAYDLGFDLEASGPARVVTSVREGSAAHRAGLRDGQTLVGWSIHADAPDREVEIQIRDAGAERTLRYLPQGAAVSVPVFTPVEGCTPERL